MNWKQISEDYPKSFKLFKDWFTDDGKKGDIGLVPHTALSGETMYMWWWVEEECPDYLSDSPLILDRGLYDFFDENDIYVFTNKEFTGSDEWEFSYRIEYLPAEFMDAKRRNINFVIVNSFIDGFTTYSGAWVTRAKAETEAFLKAFSILEERLNN